jgi:hypothetical protein
MALVAVSLLWGTYTPSLRYLYSVDSQAFTPVSVTAWRSLLSCGALLLASGWTAMVGGAHSRHWLRARQLEQQCHQPTQEQQHHQQTQEAQGVTKGPGLGTAGDGSAPSDPDALLGDAAVDNHATDGVSGWQAVGVAGAELGIYTFLGTAAQVRHCS